MSETLEQDFITVPGQLYALISIIGPDCPQKTDKHGLKIRGVFNTRDEAGSHAQRLQNADPTFDIYVVDMYKWLLIPPDTEQIDDVTYQEEFLQKMMTEYKQNQADAKRMFEERKSGMLQKPKEGSDTPFMTPGDDNSKFYTKPDIPPSKHPSEFLEELKEKNPDTPMEELVDMATKLADEINQKETEEREAKEKEEAEAKEKEKAEADEKEEPAAEEKEEVATREMPAMP